MKKEFSQPLIARPVDGSLLAWYRGSGSRRKGATLADLSGRLNNGVITFGNGSWQNTPKNHNILDFDGANTKVDCGSDFIDVLAVTVSAWINLKGWGENDSGRIIDNGKFVIIVNLDSFGKTQVLTVTSTAFANAQHSADNSIELNKWYHFSLTRTVAGVINFYINGTISGSPNVSSGTPIGGITNVIFGSDNSRSRAFKGLIDDLKVYNKIMSSSEVMEIYQQTKHLY